MVAELILRWPRSTYRITVCGSLNAGEALAAQSLSSGQSRLFPSLWGLLRWIEQDIDDSGYPQKMFQYRTWGRKGAKMTDRNEELDPQATREEPIGGATFIVQVLCRQNATWQGTIQWVQARQTQTFRSEYEMLRLMDEAVLSSARETEKSNPAWVK